MVQEASNIVFFVGVSENYGFFVYLGYYIRVSYFQKFSYNLIFYNIL